MGKNAPPNKRKDWETYDLVDECLLSAFSVPGQRVDLKEKR